MKFARFFAAVLVTTAISVFTSAAPTSAISRTDVVQTQAVVPQSVSLADGLPASELATASRLACALTTQADGRKVYCWGSTYYGAVGNGVVESGQVSYPSLVVNGSGGFSNSNVTAIDAGGGNACALQGGSVYCWGLNEFGQLGNGLTTTSGSPVKVADGDAGATPRFVNSDVTRIAVGSEVICAVRTISGTGDHLYCWGKNNQGQVGTLESSTTTTCLMMSQSIKCEKKPVLVTATSDLPNNGSEAITDLSIGSGTGCAISGGQLVCWGIQSRGNLGRTGTSDSTSYLAAAVTASDGFANTTGVTAVSIGRESVCAIEAQKVYCWGSNDLGTVGIGTSSNSETTPKKVLDNSVSGFVNASVSDVDVDSGQGETACAVAGGVAYCWGADGVDSRFTSILSVTGPDTCGSDQCALKPVKVSDGEMNNTGVTAVKVGPEFVCAIKSNVPFCWGAQGEGQLGLSGFSPNENENATTPEYYQNPWMVYKTSKPTVTAISPSSFGLSATITLTGTNLSNATQVSIGTGSGTNYCAVSAATGTSLTCTFGSNVPGMNQLTVKNLRALEAWGWGQGPTYTWTGGTSSPSGPSGPSSCSGGGGLTTSTRAVTGSVGQSMTITGPTTFGFVTTPTFILANGSFFPAGLTVNPQTGAITGTPTASASGLTSLITVSGGAASCAYRVTFTITGSSGGDSAPDSGSSTGSSGNTSASTPAPTLVTTENATALVRTPGSESIIVNGVEVSIETNVVDIPAARTPESQRTPAQVASIQRAGAALLQQFLASLPAGATSNVTVVNTATGAVMQNLVFDANGNSVNVPVEDIVFLDGPQLSLMIGSNNANITADGRYQVGAGAIVGVTGSGLGAGADGEIVAMSTPTLLANFQTTAAGDFNKSATLPESIGVGDHTLVVATGSTYAMMGIRVVPAALPTTGSSSDRVIIALFTLVFGALFFRGRRISLI